MEISSTGVAYVASGAPQSEDFGTSTGGKLFNVDLTNGVLTQLADYTDKFRSAGDLALNEITNDLFWTVKCAIPDNAPGNFVKIDCSSVFDDALFRIDIENLPAANSLVFVNDLLERDIFAMEYIAVGDDKLCYLTMGGFIFETDLSGTRVFDNYPFATDNGRGTTFVFGSGGTVPAFGATANFVGGSLIIIDNIALVVAGMETNAAWLILFMISAVGVIAYQFTGKTNSKKREKFS